MPEKQDKQTVAETKQSEAKPAPRPVFAPPAPAVVREPPKPIATPAETLAAHISDESLGITDPATTPEKQAQRLNRVDKPVRQALVGRWQAQRGNAYVQRLLKTAREAPVQRAQPEDQQAKSAAARSPALEPAAKNGAPGSPAPAVEAKRPQRPKSSQAEEESAAPEPRVTPPALPSQAAPTVADRIGEAAGKGSPLDPPVASQFGKQLGTDLSDVRVHTGAEAGDLTRTVEAVAFTTGKDIFFSPGAYAPESGTGRQLLAHEVTHTVQQTVGPVSGTPTPSGVAVSDPGDAFEQAADIAADRLTTGARASAAPLSPLPGAAPLSAPPVQRQETGDLDARPQPLDDDGAEHTITIDEVGVAQAAYGAPNFSTKDEVLTPCADAKPGEDLVDITAKVVATYKVDVKITLPTVPGNLTACQKERVQAAIDTQLSPHEDKHAAAMKQYDGTFEETIEVKRVPKAQALAKLTAAAKAAADVEGARRKMAAQDASNALDVPPFEIVVDLDCEDKKTAADDMPIGDEGDSE